VLVGYKGKLVGRDERGFRFTSCWILFFDGFGFCNFCLIGFGFDNFMLKFFATFG